MPREVSEEDVERVGRHLPGKGQGGEGGQGQQRHRTVSEHRQ